MVNAKLLMGNQMSEDNGGEARGGEQEKSKSRSSKLTMWKMCWYMRP